MGPFHVVGAADWDCAFSPDDQERAAGALEGGQVLVFPSLAYSVSADGRRFLTPAVLHKSKNVSYDPATGRVGGSACTGADAEALRRLMAGFGGRAQALLRRLLPAYRDGLRVGRTSLRPAEVRGRATSWRKDDTRLHVDSFPSQPTRGRRILRVFSNVNPEGRPRRWRVGEPFAAVAGRFWPRLRRPLPGAGAVLRLVGATKATRTHYDHYMLRLHDAMKADADYQRSAGQVVHDFPAGSTWACFTDQVSHAALAGQHQFE